MDPRAKEILDRATDIQYQYVIARMTHPDAAKAARAIGLASRSPFNWANLDELEEAVKLLRPDVIEVAKLALVELTLDAVGALGDALGDRAHRVKAAQAILDRVGLPAASSVDVTSKGESLAPIAFVEIVPPGDDGP